MNHYEETVKNLQENYIGKTVNNDIKTEISLRWQNVEFLPPNSVITADYQVGRLRVHINENNEIVSITNG